MGSLELRFSLHGAVVQIELSLAAGLIELESRLPGPRVEAAGLSADVVYRLGADLMLLRGGELLLQARTAAEALDALVSDLHFQVACHARTALFVHAGVVAVNGQAIVFPARTFSGKSTIVAALVRAGATYFSDEYAVLDRDGLVTPYLKPISLRDTDGVGWPHSVASIGGECGTGPLPVGLIVCTKYRAGAVWDPVEMSPAMGMMAMVENTVRAREMPELMMEVLAAVAGTATAVEGERGEVDEVVRWLMNRMRWREPTSDDGTV